MGKIPLLTASTYHHGLASKLQRQHNGKGMLTYTQSLSPFSLTAVKIKGKKRKEKIDVCIHLVQIIKQLNLEISLSPGHIELQSLRFRHGVCHSFSGYL